MKRLSCIEKIAIFIGITTIISLLVIAGLLLGRRLTADEKRWRSLTNPLPSSTVNDLCRKFSLSKNENLCDSKKPVYADEFFPVIAKSLPVGKATFEEVNVELGTYEAAREPPVTQSDGLQYYVIHYDLRGDGITELHFFFTEEGKVYKINYRLGNEDQ